jgi:hypothetical protein
VLRGRGETRAGRSAPVGSRRRSAVMPHNNK